MPLNEALPLLWLDSLIGALLVPVHAPYVLTIMQLFPENYPLFVASMIATIGVVIGVCGNWGIGKLATSITKATTKEEAEKSLNQRLKTSQSKLDKLKAIWLNYGHWSLLIVAIIPFLAQAFAVLAGWSGVPLKRMLFPSFIGALAVYLLPLI